MKNINSNELSVENELYKNFHNMFEEIQKHKWIESEKCGRDIGFESALLDWLKEHRKNWINNKC